VESPASSAQLSARTKRSGRWSQTESARFEAALAEFGLNQWEEVAKRVQTRSALQVRVKGKYEIGNRRTASSD
jgi:hypothetical protein